jgi:hypothetical protein
LIVFSKPLIRANYAQSNTVDFYRLFSSFNFSGLLWVFIL